MTAAEISAPGMSADREELHQARRSALWARLTAALPVEWERIVMAGGRSRLDEALDLLISRKRVRNFPEKSVSDYNEIVDISNNICDQINKLNDMVGEAVASVIDTEDKSICSAAFNMLEHGDEAALHLNYFLVALAKFHESLPEQAGGRGVLSKQIKGEATRPFREFAETARDVWQASGLTIGGNGVADQGFGAFLDAVHAEVFGRTLPSRTKMMSALRNTWPKPRIR